MSYATLQNRLLDQIARPESLSDDAAFNTLALEIHAFQRRENTPYAQFCRHLGAPEQPAHWSEIPAVPTGAFRHAPLRAFPESETAATFRTSGTTGEGFGSHHFRSLALYEASILGAWDALGIPPLPQAILVAPPGRAPHSSLSHMMGALGARGAQHWCLNAAGRLNLPALRQVAGSGPALFLGTALAFLHLFEELGAERLALHPGSLALETGGYKGSGRSLTKEALYTLFEEKLALAPEAVFNEYSMTELSSQWYTRGLGRPHHGPPWCRALVVDPATGTPVEEGGRGCVRLFDLANLGSVLALQTQDLAIAREGGFELIGRDPAALPRGCSRAADELFR